MNTNSEEKTEKKEKKISTDTKVKIVLLMIIFGLAASCAYSILFGKKSSPAGMPTGGAGGAPASAPTEVTAPNAPAMSQADKKQVANTITVSAKTMKKEKVEKTIKLTGDVTSKTQVNVYPDTDGKVTSIKAKLGDFVKKGDVIAYVDSSKPGSYYAASPVVAIVDGTIIELPVNTGDTITRNTVVAKTGSLTDLTIAVSVAEKYSPFLKLGLPAYVTLTVAPDSPYLAKIAKLSPIVNKANRTIQTELEFDRLDDKVKPGMFASVNLVVQESKNTFVVPKSAIKTYNGKEVVYLIDDENFAKRVFVTTGIGNDVDIEIVSGVEEGMKVVTAGSVTENSPVRIAEVL